MQLASGRLRPRHLFGFMFDAARQGGGHVKLCFAQGLGMGLRVLFVGKMGIKSLYRPYLCDPYSLLRTSKCKGTLFKVEGCGFTVV